MVIESYKSIELNDVNNVPLPALYSTALTGLSWIPNTVSVLVAISNVFTARSMPPLKHLYLSSKQASSTPALCWYVAFSVLLCRSYIRTN